MANTTLAELALEVNGVEIDGEKADRLSPTYNSNAKYVVCDSIAKEAGILPNSPKYSGLHNHCQYSRTC